MYTWNESVTSRGPQKVELCILQFVENYVKTIKKLPYSRITAGDKIETSRWQPCVNNYIVSLNEWVCVGWKAKKIFQIFLFRMIGEKLWNQMNKNVL